ncbi:hypothetical protein [Burkholderia ubonensis]|uniref:hypothetical protein n=1 Tax=Burkholderia ubonensis TaxID=101571 RepID=UPI0007523AD8|nr:hypothetical protein [Burkholderia ubonensis]KVP17415.1 hypothetical protein WJ84_04060 [Burkholderia ubonensis]
MSEQTPSVPALEHSVLAESFVFYFSFQDGDAARTYGFIVRNVSMLLAALNAEDFSAFTELLYDDIVDELEGEYGVHDWSTRPSQEVEAIGFTSYEVEPEDEKTLLERWQAWFVSKGATVTPVVPVDESVVADGDDFAIYHYIEATLAR